MTLRDALKAAEPLWEYGPKVAMRSKFGESFQVRQTKDGIRFLSRASFDAKGGWWSMGRVDDLDSKVVAGSDWNPVRPAKEIGR